MHILSTALAGLFALLSTAFVLIAYQQAQRANEAQIACARAASKLNAMAGRVIALEGALETLQAQHRKLSGKFYAAKNSETPASPDVGPAPAGLRQPAAYCANWQDGQREGPLSEAARCVCDYCCEMRDRRSQTKLDLLPAARTATLGTPRTRE